MTPTRIIVHVASVALGRANRRALLRARLAEGFLETGFHLIVDSTGAVETDQVQTPGDLLVSVANPEVCFDSLVTLAALLMSPEYRGVPVVLPKELQEWHETAVQPFLENQ